MATRRTMLIRMLVITVLALVAHVGFGLAATTTTAQPIAFVPNATPMPVSQEYARYGLPDVSWPDGDTPFPEQVNTQGGSGVITDGAGKEYLIGRSVEEAHMVVYLNGACVLCPPEAYGAPFIYQRPDGQAEVQSFDRNGRTLHRWLLPNYVGVSYNARAAMLGQVFVP